MQEEKKESSATTQQTKTYIGGGTTPNSPILVKKPIKKNYMYGILGVIGVLVFYKFFYNKKA